MASMKPLFTITVLLIVGVYLYKTINEGPVRPHGGAQGAAEQSAAGVPPLAAAGGAATLAQDSAAPAWPANSPSAGPAAPVLPPGVSPAGGASPAVASTPTTDATAAADPTKAALPEVPPIPELPALPTTSDGALPAANPSTTPSVAGAVPGSPSTPGAVAIPTATPVPVAPQLDQAPPAGNAATAAPATPPAAGATSDAITPLPVEPAQAGAEPSVPATPPVASVPPAAAQSSVPGVAVPGSAMPAPSDDRYALNATTPPAPTTPIPVTPTEAAPATSGATSFAASWPAIQAALAKNDLKQAHQLLSKWHGDESLSPADAQKVESLLGQLAGTVIYSNEHRLEPARVVKPGETLESISREYNVPWQLLAKINSIPAPDQVRPGQELKVVRGPFSAVVDLHRRELTLEVDGRYAGTFPVTVPSGSAVVEGQWTVDQKVAGQPSAVAPAAYAAPPSAADRAIVLRNAASAQPGGPTLTITSGTPAAPPSAGAVAIQVAPQDAEDLSDILSIGSRVVVRK